MNQYIVVKQFTTASIVFLRNKLVSPDDINEAKIKRLINRGYIKHVESTAATYNEPAYYKKSDELLPPREVNRLKKSELIDYATHIGVKGLNPADPITVLRGVVNKFVSKALLDSGDDETNKADDSGDDSDSGE